MCIIRRACGETTALDCVLADDWQPWSDCDSRCGYGVQSRLREVLVQPLNGGQECGETIQRRLCEGTQCKLPRSHHGAVSQLKGIDLAVYPHVNYRRFLPRDATQTRRARLCHSICRQFDVDVCPLSVCDVHV